MIDNLILTHLSLKLPSQPEPTADNYENIQINYQLPATTEATNNGPRLPARQVIVYSKTLSLHSDIDGVPFILDPRFAKPAKNEVILEAFCFF